MPCINSVLRCRKCGAREPMRTNWTIAPTTAELEAIMEYFRLVLHKPRCPLWSSPSMKRL